MSESNFPIDAVITWVDGQDPDFLKKKQGFSDSNLFEAKNATRYNEVGELNYAIRSILKYAPFIRTIYILTDNQKPAIIEESKTWSPYYRDKLKLVDHKEVFRDHPEVLPTFNSLTIETMLYNIKGLAEHFIYFNDDVFLIKPTKPEDWFVEGKPVIRGKWTPLPNKVWYKKLFYSLNPKKLKKAGYKRAQALSAEIAGFDSKYFRTYHHAKPLVRSHFESYFRDHPDVLRDQIKHRFRSSQQFNPYVLIWHREILQDLVHLTNKLQLIEVTYKTHNPPKKVLKELNQAVQSEDVLFLNLQSLDLLPEDHLSKVLEVLTKITEIDLTRSA